MSYLQLMPASAFLVTCSFLLLQLPFLELQKLSVINPPAAAKYLLVLLSVIVTSLLPPPPPVASTLLVAVSVKT